jgi:hypothetical protein
MLQVMRKFADQAAAQPTDLAPLLQEFWMTDEPRKSSKPRSLRRSAKLGLTIVSGRECAVKAAAARA